MYSAVEAQKANRDMQTVFKQTFSTSLICHK